MMIMVIYNKKEKKLKKKNIKGKMIVKWNCFLLNMPFHLAHFYPYKTQKENEEKKT